MNISIKPTVAIIIALLLPLSMIPLNEQEQITTTSTIPQPDCSIPTISCPSTEPDRVFPGNGVNVNGHVDPCGGATWRINVVRNAILMRVYIEKTSNEECLEFTVGVTVYKEESYINSTRTNSNATLLIQNPGIGEWVIYVSGSYSGYTLNVNITYSGSTTPTTSPIDGNYQNIVILGVITVVSLTALVVFLVGIAKYRELS
ncbi:MAG: hypothetical protein RTU30_14700 [Candidatus Thorarchaeota archaeon]